MHRSSLHPSTSGKVILLIVLAGCLFLLATATLASNKNPDQGPLKFIIPVKTRHAIIQFTLPKQYKLAFNGTKNQRVFLEFIPKEESLSSWSRIATFIQYPNRTTGARNTIEQIIAGLKEHPQVSFHTPPLLRETQLYGVEIQTATLNYRNEVQKRNEILMIKSLQGDKDIWMFQATAAYKEQGKDEAVQACEAIMDAVTIAAKHKN